MLNAKKGTKRELPLYMHPMHLENCNKAIELKDRRKIRLPVN